MVPVSDAISGCGCLIYQAFYTKRDLPYACLHADHAGCIATSDLAQRFLLHVQDFSCKSIQTHWGEVKIPQQEWIRKILRSLYVHKNHKTRQSHFELVTLLVSNSSYILPN